MRHKSAGSRVRARGSPRLARHAHPLAQRIAVPAAAHGIGVAIAVAAYWLPWHLRIFQHFAYCVFLTRATRIAYAYCAV